jgi:hypothetical protein
MERSLPLVPGDFSPGQHQAELVLRLHVHKHKLVKSSIVLPRVCHAWTVRAISRTTPTKGSRRGSGDLSQGVQSFVSLSATQCELLLTIVPRSSVYGAIQSWPRLSR